MDEELQLALLGNPEVRLGGVSVSGFNSAKAQALAYYLAVTGRPVFRPTLAGLLWGEMPETNARRNLRKVVANLRHLLAPHLNITRQTVAFNRDSPYWLDVEILETAVGNAPIDTNIERLREAVDLYRGDFLEGFYVRQAPAFEEWVLTQQTRLRELALGALHRLAAHYTQLGGAGRTLAIDYTSRLLALEPWREESHRQMMLLLALGGQRGAALAQYETCRRVLAEEFGVEPGGETAALYERIRDGDLSLVVSTPGKSQVANGKGDTQTESPRASQPPSPPAFLSDSEEEPVGAETPVFVGREEELAQLERFLDLALAGQGRVAFVIGGAGRGKTALLTEFARRDQERHSDLIVASGHCNAFSGIGDPYLPFREILELLTGDVEAGWAAGSISREHARRLWDFFPDTIQTLLNIGPDLFDVFISGDALMARARTAAPGEDGCPAQLETLLAHRAADPGAANLTQRDLFAQYTKVLQVLARQRPLLLILDDLQWADAGSISLLFHLGKRLKGHRILIVGIYRPYDVALGRDGERHPLESVVNEFQRDFGDNPVNLRRARGQQFVEALLETEPNRLSPAFQEMLYRQTRGHALFTVEMVRGMQERGDLVQDARGRWVEGPDLDWETLPARVEGVIRERIGRLPARLQETLKVASVEGEEFTAEVVAQVQAVDASKMVRLLSGALDQQYRLVRSQSSRRLVHTGQRLSRYSFRHILFQRYLYNSLDEAERVYLHETVGQVLEQLHGGQTEEIAAQLARHFQAARLAVKAVDYLRQAGDRARRLSANEEAIAHFKRGLALLETLPDTSERAQQELTLQIALSNALISTKGFAALEVGKTYTRARALCRQVGETPQLYTVLQGLQRYYLVRGELQTARELGEQLLHLAQQQQNLAARLAAHTALGATLFYLGELASAQEHLGQGFALYDVRQHGSLAFVYGLDPGVTCLFHEALILWNRGYPEKALTRSHQALSLAQELSHPFTLACASYHLALLHQLRREKQPTLEQAQATIAVSIEHDFPLWLATATIIQGWILVGQGEMKEGITRIRQGLDTLRTLGTVTGGASGESQYLSVLAEAYGRAGLAEEGLRVLAEALAAVNNGGERMWEAELYRLKGELLLKDESGRRVMSPVLSEVEGAAEGMKACPERSRRDELSPEACFHKAIEVACQQDAKSLELRAVMSLSRLWKDQERKEEARQMLAEIYDWFSEGFDTPDLKEARELLAELT